MHGEQPVEDLGRNKIVVRTNKLNANDGRFHSGDHQKHQRINDVQNAQSLVVNGGNPIVEPGDNRA